jgi:xanthine/uracil permease
MQLKDPEEYKKAARRCPAMLPVDLAMLFQHHIALPCAAVCYPAMPARQVWSAPASTAHGVRVSLFLTGV